MLAAVLHGPGDIRPEEIETPKPGPDEVIIQVKAVGICGSDLPRVLKGTAHYFPIVLGHEFSGLIAELGTEVKGLSLGTKATAAPLIPCLKCRDCQRGDYALCTNYKFIGSSLFGAFAEYVKVPARNVVTFKDQVAFDRAAFFEPSTVALHGLLCSNFRPGLEVAVLGGGTVGLFTLQWAKILGASRISVFDISQARLDLASKLGATAVFNPDQENFRERVKDFTGGRGFDYIFETAGQNATMSLAFELAANKARLCFIGTSTKDLHFPWPLFEKLNRKELNLTGSWMSYSPPFPGREWTWTADRLGDGKLKFDPSFIHRSFPLVQAASAFELFKDPRSVQGKILLTNP
ncbi:MAG: galactitol-1-phosphate 5-dehydrogenase [Deltaproteobacteria bacterium]|jgi:L-iditol 2-dehydrogenase|nr:galactitol-1-phosphate 5-dehydrogenase [Deltaproteobacteria bacterium]